MKISDSTFDTVIYVIVCILTGGIAWIARIIITHAIREAFIKEK